MTKKIPDNDDIFAKKLEKIVFMLFLGDEKDLFTYLTKKILQGKAIR